jgi:hypothetical protein
MADPNQIGKRYKCTTCDAEVMCVKGGAGRLECHGTTMERMDAKPLPSSD